MNTYVIDSKLSRDEIMKRLNATQEQVLTVGSECAASVWTAEDIAEHLAFKKDSLDYAFLGLDELFREAGIKPEDLIKDRYLLEDTLEDLHDFLNSDDDISQAIRNYINYSIEEALNRRIKEIAAEKADLQ